MSEAAFRSSLVDSGTADELIRALVALGESGPPRPHFVDGDAPGAWRPSEADALPFLLEHFAQGKLPPLTTRTTSVSTYEAQSTNTYLKARLADLTAELKDTLTKLRETLPEGTLSVSNISAAGVPDADVRGGVSDPFVRISLLGAHNLDDEGEPSPGGYPGAAMDPLAFAAYCDRHGIAAQTSTAPNSTDPVWEGETLSIVLPAGTPRPPKVLVRVWDDDVTKSDEPLASAEVQLEPGEGACEGLVLAGRAGLPDVTISFTYAVADNAAREALEEGE